MKVKWRIRCKFCHAVSKSCTYAELLNPQQTPIRNLLAIGIALAAAYLRQTKRTNSVSVAEAEKNVAVRVFGLGTVEARAISKVGFEVGAALVELTQ